MLPPHRKSLIAFAALSALLITTATPEDAPKRSDPRQVDRSPRPIAEVVARGREVVDEYEDKQLAAWGILDVTKAPYDADPSGETDSTDAIQRAVLDAGGPRALTPFPVRNCTDFRIFGHGGNASPAEGEPMYRIENCSDFLLANFTYQPLKKGADPETWFMVEEVARDGQTVRRPGTEFFAAYKRD